MNKRIIIRLISIVLSMLLLVSGIYAYAGSGGERAVSKIEFVKLICDKAKIKPLLYSGGFKDVTADYPDAEIIAGALQSGIIDSAFADDEGNLRAEEAITKEEAVAIVVKGLTAMKNNLSVGTTVAFDDKGDISPKLLTYIEVAVANGVIEDKGNFNPGGVIGVSEAEAMAENMYECYKRLPVMPNSGIMRVQFHVIAQEGIEPPGFLPEGYQLVFSDDFDGDSLDTTKWGYNYSWGNSHNHAAWCVPENVIVKDGILTLKGENKQHPDAVGKQGTFNNKKYDIVYTSGAIHTHHKFNFDYGYFEARLKMPKGKGMWPAWWMLKDGWPPEIDMLEVLCSKPNELHVNFHYGPAWNEHYSHEQVLDLGFDTTEDFHTYGFEWTPDYMRYYVDGVQVGHDFTNKSAISEAKGMYMILNLAIDGWDGKPDETTQWPALYQCDYVRVWQMNE